MKVEDIARICHEANRGLQRVAANDAIPVAPSWDEASEHMRRSIVAGVNFHLSNPEAAAHESHANWLAFKVADGWEYGPVKDEATKKHPCILPFTALPVMDQAKDHLFKSIVNGLARFVALVPVEHHQV